MTIVELKDQILNKTVPTGLLVFLMDKKDKDNSLFICNQYINAIAKNRDYVINRINKLTDISESALSLVFDLNTKLNILITDKFNEAADFGSLENCIIACYEIDDAIKYDLEPYTVSIPALLEWNMLDYIKTCCTGLEEDEIKWLYKATKHNIFKLDNEVSKIALFPAETQRGILSELRFESNTDLCSLSFFNFIEAIVKKDKLTILEGLEHKAALELTSFGLIAALTNKVESVLYVTYNYELPIDTSKVNKKMGYYYQMCPEGQLVNMLAFLTQLDQEVKLGKLELSEDQFIDYIICKLMEI